MGLNGWVLNSSQGVFIEIEGEKNLLDIFLSRLEKEKPPRSYIQGMEFSFLDVIGFTKFEIRESSSNGEKSAIVLPDIATCPDCASEILDPSNRRYLYPFTNCTNCGPRFSIIRALPYDRSNTTMQKFEMCEKCREEYNNPLDRRFHAQPNACPKCGPHIELWDKSGGILSMRRDALLHAADSLRRGKTVALKGIGGFQLIVDARNEEAVKLLRTRKHREEKPFALMYPSLEYLKRHCEISEVEERLLLSPEAPIVLLRRKKITLSKSKLPLRRFPETDNPNSFHECGTFARLKASDIADSVAPRNPYLGAMLPYTPLHLILMCELGFPVVATSGNISDEPICIDEHEALEKLRDIADLFLVHDRPIERHVDDSVVRIMMERVQMVRRARGYAPFPIELDGENHASVLAVGGHLKNTIAINSGNNIFVSQHIGDLSTEEAFKAFEKVTRDFQKLYEISPQVIAHDIHPDYLSTQFARAAISSQQSAVSIQHHFAHVASCMAENKLNGQVLGVSWDGTGYGEVEDPPKGQAVRGNGTVWGGEFLLTDGGDYKRVATFRSFRLPGNSASVKEPRRTALGVLYEIFGEKLFGMTEMPPVNAFEEQSLPILKKMLETGLNSPTTTSAGRLFDAVSSIIGLRQVVNFEGQGAMELEFAADGTESDDCYDFDVTGNRRKETGDRTGYEPSFIVNWEPMVKEILDDKSRGMPVGLIAAKFHNTLAAIIVDVAKRVGEERVVISGGCFQNRYLTERTIWLLSGNGFKPYWHQRIPPNDGGISLGQLFVALRKEKRRQETKGKVEEWNCGRMEYLSNGIVSRN